MGQRGFSYSMVESPETKEVFQRMLDEDADRVLKYRASKPNRRPMPAKQLVAVWFVLKGPTAFDTATDAIRYRNELIRVVDAKLIPLRAEEDQASRTAAAAPWLE